jgi:hypothetical protein
MSAAQAMATKLRNRRALRLGDEAFMNEETGIDGPG